MLAPRTQALGLLLALPLAGATAACSASSASSASSAGAGGSPGIDGAADVGVAPSDGGVDSVSRVDGAGSPEDGGGDATVRADAGEAGEAGEAGADLDMQAGDFVCILGWSQVGDYRITNMLGNQSGALSVAQSSTGGTFPVGTVIQLIPNEAMVKRRAGFDPTTHDWEFFNLSTSASGTVINQRGGASVVNALGGSCATCHGMAQPQWDSVCATTHGCNPLPFTEAQILAVQNADPRCHGG